MTNSTNRNLLVRAEADNPDALAPRLSPGYADIAGGGGGANIFPRLDPPRTPRWDGGGGGGIAAGGGRREGCPVMVGGGGGPVWMEGLGVEEYDDEVVVVMESGEV